MAREGPAKYQPAFSRGGFGPARPASSAPALRRSGGTTPPSSDDEGGGGNSITNRCSPKAVYVVVSKFSEFKKQLVRDIGFGGILDLPCISKLNLKLSTFLLSKVDTDESALVLSSSRRIWFHERDIGIVFGIPNGDMDVGSVEISPEQIDLIRQSCGLDNKDPRSCKGLELVLQQHLDEASTTLEINRFKVAFVIFVMGHLLAPSVKHDRCNVDFFGALKNTDKIDKFNWCRYVYSYVLEGARKVQGELFRRGHVTCLTGCHLFLQILFLDNVDIRSLNKPHSIVPRIKVFDAESLRTMTMMCSSHDQNDFSRFTGIRSPSSCAYMRRYFRSPHNISSSAGSLNPVVMALKPISAPLIGTASTGQLTPETFQFNQPSDLGVYIRTKYPGLGKTYAMDFIQMHNAQLMQEMAKLRVTLIRRNAELVDWLVQHVGSTQLQLIHRRPASQMKPADPNVPTHSDAPRIRISGSHQMQPSRNEDVAESSTGTSGPPVGPNVPKRSISFNEKQNTKKLRTASDVDVPAEGDPNNIADPSCNVTLQSATTPLQQHPINKPNLFEYNASDPSFDLGIEQSQNPAQFVTPKANVFPINAPTSPVPYQQSSPKKKMSLLSKQATPESSTKENAYNIIIDHVDVAEEEIGSNDKVSYLLPIDENFVKVTVPIPPPNVATWKDCERHPTPDPEAVEMLGIWCKKSATDEDNSRWVIHSMPRFLWLYGKELKDNLLGSMVIIPDVIDLLIRRFNQLDAANQKTDSSLRWRHYFESSFSLLSISAMGPEKCQSVLNQFLNHQHCIAHCTMIVIPLLIEGSWCAYMLNLNTVEVHVLDPIHSTERQQLHQIFYKIIYTSLVSCIEQFFDGWEFDPHDEWELHYPKLSSDSFSREDSGICMLHFARYFNGKRLEFPITQDMLPYIRMSLLYEALSISGNEGELPAMVKRLLS